MRNGWNHVYFEKVQAEDGSLTYYIIAERQRVEVSEEVFRMYVKDDRRERYEIEREIRRKTSLEHLEEMNFPLVDPLPSAESLLLEDEQARQTHALLLKLHDVLTTLTDKERAMIDALYVRQISTRDYAKELGVDHKTVTYHRDRLLMKLGKLLCPDQ